MSNPTRQEIIDAYKALEELYDWALEWAGTRAHSRYGAIRDVLPPKPKTTMADVRWDDDEHYLAEAVTKDYGSVIMLSDATYNPDLIECLIPHHEDRGARIHKRLLTPTGKRYTLTEVQE